MPTSVAPVLGAGMHKVVAPTLTLFMRIEFIHCKPPSACMLPPLLSHEHAGVYSGVVACDVCPSKYMYSTPS